MTLIINTLNFLYKYYFIYARILTNNIGFTLFVLKIIGIFAL